MLVRVSEKMRKENLSWRSWGNLVLLCNTWRSLSVMLQLILRSSFFSSKIISNVFSIYLLKATHFLVQCLKNHRHTLTNKFLWTFLYTFSQLIRLFRQQSDVFEFDIFLPLFVLKFDNLDSSNLTEREWKLMDN